MGEKLRGGIEFVKRKFGNWMDDSGYNKADIADVVVPVVTALVAIATTVLWELAPTDLGWAALGRGETLLAIVAALATLVLTFVTGKRALSTRAEARQALSAFSNSLSGTADAVASLMKSERNLTDCHRFVDSMLREAKDLMPVSQCRATLYSLEEDEQAEGGGQYLERVGRSKGRSDQARVEFRPDTAHGQAVIRVVMDGKPRFIANHRLREFEIDRDKEAIWRAFCVVPIATADGVWGALFLDSDKITLFSREKKHIALAIARFLEIGIELLDSAARDLVPERDQAISQLVSVAQAPVGSDRYSDAKNDAADGDETEVKDDSEARVNRGEEGEAHGKGS